jgi:PAS domain S-box-containing protein
MMAIDSANLESHFAAEKEKTFPRFNFRQRLLLCGVALAGLAVSLLLYWRLTVHEYQMADAHFRLLAEKKAEAIMHAFTDHLNIMGLVKTFYAGSLEVDREEFKIFVDAVFKEYPDIKLFAWIPEVSAQQRLAHEQSIRKTGFPEYQITQRRVDEFIAAGRREQYFPILFIEPQDKEKDAIGFDLGSIPECRVAMKQAQADQCPTITYTKISGISLDGDSFPVMYIFEEAHTEAIRATNNINGGNISRGFILGAFDLQGIVIQAIKAMELLQPAGVDSYLFDVTDRKKPMPILSSPSRIRVSPLPFLQAPPESSAAIEYRAEFPMADRTWLVYCRPTDVYFRYQPRWGSLTALLTGILTTALIVGYLFLLLGRTARIEKLVAERTGELQASEKRFRLLVDNAADGVFIYDDQENILDVNQQACNQLGYTRDELLKMHTFEFEISLTRQEISDFGWNLPDEDFPITIHGVHRRKDGSTYPVEVRSNRMIIAGKRFIMCITRDVTERKQAEEALRKEQRFLRHLIDLQERERKLMAYEIHDGLAQQLTAAAYKLQGLKAALEKQDLSASRENLEEILRLIHGSVEEARRLISGLRPPVLDELGIIAAIEYLVGEWQQNGEVQIEFAHQVQFQRLAPPLEAALFRIAQEGLNNACRYSQSPKIRVELSQLENRIRLTVQDWGVGFDAQAVKGDSFGLRGIRERVRLLGGTVQIDSAEGRGTTITAELPMSEADISDYN